MKDAVALAVGDQASAAGLLREDGAVHRLIFRGEDRYGELFNATEYAALPIHDLSAPPVEQMVTVHGTWTGDAITDASVTQGGLGIAPAPCLDVSRLGDIDGAQNRSEILRDDVRAACAGIRGGALVAFVAVAGSHGWFGLASAVDPAHVQRVLRPALGSRLHVVQSPWSLNDVDNALDAALRVVDPFQFGYFWDDRVRFRAEMVVHHISVELASVLEQCPPEILRVASWLQREERSRIPGSEQENGR